MRRDTIDLKTSYFILHPLSAAKNGAKGMNTPCWEAGEWTALVGGNPTERIWEIVSQRHSPLSRQVAVQHHRSDRDTTREVQAEVQRKVTLATAFSEK